MEDIELIENYHEGRLNEEEKSSFEARLLNDSNLKLEFDIYKNIVTGIKEIGNKTLKENLISLDKEFDAETKTIELKNVKASYFKTFSIAASVLIIAGLSVFYIYFNNSNYPELATKYYEQETGLPVEMGINKNRWDDVMNDYKTGNYTEAKSKLKKIVNINKNDTASYFLGVVNYELKNYGEAINSFSNVKLPSFYFEKSNYRLVLTYLKTNEKKEAIRLINEALQNKEHPFYFKLNGLKSELSK